MIRPYRPEVDGLRTVAVLSVLLFHFRIPGFDGGFVGVDIFFVISGFLITRLIMEDINHGTFTFGEFYGRRIRRILPALFVTIVATMAVGALLMSLGAFQDLAGSAIASALSVANFFFWFSSGYFDTGAYTKPLLHTWSLGVEEQFYLFWPFLLLIASKWWRPAALVAAAFIASLVAAEWYVGSDPSGAFYLLPFRVYEFAIGAGLVWFVDRYHLRGLLADACTLAGLLLIALTLVLFTEETRFPGISALVPCIGAALIIFAGASPRASLLLTNRPALWVGKISYSLYLVHWPVIVYAEYFLLRELRPLETVAGLATCFVLAALMYRLVETPFRNKKSGAFSISRRAVALWMVAGLAVILIPSYSAWTSGGWSWRVRDLPGLANIKNPRDFHLVNFAGRGCALPRCETGGTGPKVYLIGDSHAGSFYAGLKGAFPDVNFVIFGPNSCPVYSLRFTNHNDAYTQGCNAARKRIFDEIAKKDGDVIIVQHWAARMTSPHYSDDQSAEPRRFATAPDFAKFVINELDGIQGLIGDRKLIVMGGVPRVPVPPFDCISRPIRPSGCETSPVSSWMIRVPGALNKAFRAEANDRFAFLDPFAYLCRSGECRNFTRAGAPIYSDKTHLSQWGSVFLVSALRHDLRAMLNLPAPSN